MTIRSSALTTVLITLFILLSSSQVSRLYGQYDPIGDLKPPAGGVYIFRSVEEKDGYIYVVTRDGKLLTYDGTEVLNGATSTSQSHSQQFISINEPLNQLDLELPKVSGMLINGSVLYVYGRKWLAVDLQNPANPSILKTLLDMTVQFLAIDGPYLAAGLLNSFRLYSMDDPLSPVELSEIDYSQFSGTLLNGLISENHLIISAYGQGGMATIRVFDISDPENPISIKSGL